MKIFSYRYLPLNIYLAYSFFVLLCLFLQPINYENINYIALVSYICIILIMFATGYIGGAKGEMFFQSNLDTIYVNKSRKMYGLVKGGVYFTLVCTFFYVLQQWVDVFSVGGVGLDLSKLGESYVKYYDGYERGQAKVDFLYIINILAQSVLTLSLFFGFFYFREMPRFVRWSFLFVVVSYILINVLVSGKQKFFGDVVIITVFSYLLNMARYRRRFKFKTVTVISISVLVVFAVFIELLNQRYSAAGIGIHNIAEKVHPLMKWEQESLWFDLFGDDYGFAIGIFLWYFTNGIYGLSLSLSLPFEWTYFVGNSYSLARIVEITLGGDVSIIEKTYPVRVGDMYGWGLSKWHSLFSWLASDITFAGVVVLSFFFGRFYGRLWVSAVSLDNPFSGPLFLNLSLGLIFSFSNNQIMHGMAGVIALSVLLFCYFYYSLCKRLTC